MSNITYSLFYLLSLFSFLSPEKETTLSFIPVFQNVPLTLTEKAQKINDSLQIETFKCYISNIEFYNNDDLVFAEKNSFHLLDASDTNSLSIQIPTSENLRFSHIQFNIGIDSLTHSLGVFGGDLDPTNGMYWTWQSGYINFKLEGIARDCPARHNRFQYHIGGYQGTFNTLQQVNLAVTTSDHFSIAVAIDKVFSEMDLKENYQIMSPGEEAVAISNSLPSLFSIITE